MNEREIALEILMRMEPDQAHPHSLLREMLDKYDYLAPQQKALIKHLADGTTERRITLDFLLGHFTKTPVEKLKPLIRCLLRMSIYQILYMDQIPDSAAINEAVKLVDKRGLQGLKGYVNGVLRSISREKNALPLPAEKEEFYTLPPESGKACKALRSEATEFLRVTYSMPAFLTGMWLKSYGYEATKKMLAALLEVRPVTIRLDDMIENPGALLEQMQAESDGRLEIKAHPLLPYAYELTHTDNLRYLYGYEEGKFLVQDVSSMLVTQIAGLRAGDTVIDVCAAPGGKSLHAAARLRALGGGRVYSRHISEGKCDLIRENAARLSLTEYMEIAVHDATVPDEALFGEADVLYCDLPCSGLGIIGRKTDIKYSVTPEGMESLVALQRQILESVWQYVKPGGTLMYSTCTIHKAENEEQVSWILENLPFEVVDITRELPETLQGVPSAAKGYVQLLPGMADTDGFFIARLRRKA